MPLTGSLAGIDMGVGMGASVSQIRSERRGAPAEDHSQDSSSDGNTAPVFQRPSSPLDYIMSNPMDDVPDAFKTKVTATVKHSSGLNGFQDEDPEELAAFTQSRLLGLSEDELAKHRRSEDILRMKEGFRLLGSPQPGVDPGDIIRFFFPWHMQADIAQACKDCYDNQPEGSKGQARGASGSPCPADPAQNSTKG